MTRNNILGPKFRCSNYSYKGNERKEEILKTFGGNGKRTGGEVVGLP
jgi:hypothetical protein